MPSAEAAAARILLRAACSPTVGLGHARRCLTLAEAIVARGGAARLVVAPAPAPFTAREGVSLGIVTGAEPDATIAEAAAWGAQAILVDDYAFDAHALAGLRRVVPTGVVDDLADRTLDVDLVLNGGANAQTLGYQARGGRLLLGPEYALLRPPFQALPRPPVPEVVRAVLVTMGGSDPMRLTSIVTRVVLDELPGATVIVVVGPLAPAVAIDDPRVRVHVAPDDMASLMREVDLAVSAGGQTLYELAAAGVPTLAIEVAANQRGNLASLAAAGTLIVTTPASLGAHLRTLAGDPARRAAMTTAGQALIDGHGAERVAEALFTLATRSTEKPHG